MAIELIMAPTGGAPLGTADYNSQNVIIQALLYHLMQKTRHLSEWDSLVKPELLENVYIQHGGALFQVKTEDYTITGAPADDHVYVKITRTADELDAAFVNSAAGYSWNNVYNGFYHADGTQLLLYLVWLDTGDYYKFRIEDTIYLNKPVMTEMFVDNGYAGGSIEIEIGLTWVPPSGLYNFAAPGAEIEVEQYIAGNWRNGPQIGIGFTLICDGTNQRIRNNKAAPLTIYWQRFDFFNFLNLI